MSNKITPPPLTEGEATIRRALRRSLLGLGLLIALGAVAYLLLHKSEQTEPVSEAEIRAPEVDQQRTSSHPPELRYTDITEQAGIDFTHVNGAYGERLMPETIGSGAAFFDYDNDADQDLFLVNFRHWPDHRGETTPLQALYRNDGSGHFEDVTSGGPGFRGLRHGGRGRRL